jgi:hypothetical protein
VVEVLMELHLQQILVQIQFLVQLHLLVEELQRVLLRMEGQVQEVFHQTAQVVLVIHLQQILHKVIQVEQVLKAEALVAEVVLVELVVILLVVLVEQAE